MGMTRQNYYKLGRQRQRLSVDEDMILALVRHERQVQPRLGTRKLLHVIQGELSEACVSIGRDRFFELLRSNGMLILRRRASARTTDSRHMFRLYRNLIKDLAIERPHQVLVSDITYIRSDEGFLYLCLVMDAFSRAIVGFDCSDNLEREGAMRALAQALKQLPSGSGAIHHSDRGCQYCCHEYVGMLEAASVSISMTQENHCYENAQAERLNGILKQEYGLGGSFRWKEQAMQAVAQAVELYNWRRPHESLGYATPMAVHHAA
jgi:transposase InsO family protein